MASATAMEIIHEEEIVYPESDGEPMADNTRQFRWIVTIQGGLDALFQENPQVFVAGNIFWYPVQGRPDIRRAPDVLVAFGRPKGDRGSYLQWKEEDIAPQVVFEILSPGNTIKEMFEKFEFYDTYGVQEYYLYDPDRNDLSGWLRTDDRLQIIAMMDGWVSPRLGIQFDFSQGELQIYRPDGQRFATYVELQQQREQEQQRAEQEHQRAEQEHQRAEYQYKRAERMALKLREMGIDPEYLVGDDEQQA